MGAIATAGDGEGKDPAMEYRALGRTGISVSHLTLGAMMLGAMGNQDREECVRIVHRALEKGITSINTADGYSAG